MKPGIILGGTLHVNVYLVRHGDALDAARDPERPLSDLGRREIETLAGALRGRIAPLTIHHSDKRRARETAQLLHTRAFADARLQEATGLAPTDAPEPWAALLEHDREDTLLVAHLPFVSRLASLLLSGDAQRTRFAFASGACLALQRSGSLWAVQWMLDPVLCGLPHR